MDDPAAGVTVGKPFLSAALGLSRWLGSPLRVLSTDFARSRWLAASGGALPVEWVALPGGASLRREIEEVEGGWVLLPVNRRERRERSLAGWKLRLLESAPLPVLLLPPGLRPRERGFDSFVVPVSGEVHTSSALHWAIRRGGELGVPVDVLHVSRVGGARPDGTEVGLAQDQFHHEYPQLVEHFISQASPYTSSRENRVIREFCHCSGDPVARLLERAGRNRHDLIVLEWKGSMDPGRAQLVREVIGRGESPVLLVRHHERGCARLKVGAEFGG